MNSLEIKILLHLVKIMLRKERKIRLSLGMEIKNWDKIAGAFGNLNQLIFEGLKVKKLKIM